jgi:DHA1 family inner membrane transport protein
VLTNPDSRRGGHRAVGAVLFACLFAGQAGAIALSPVLAQVARDLDVSTALAGQLRTIAGLAAGVTALALGRLAARVRLSRLLLGGSLLLAVGSLVSAAAPSFATLAAAQIPVGAAIAILTTAGTLAAAEWVPAERRAATLSWALIGQPAAWIVGMPLLGVAGEQSWRYAWLVLPFAAAVVAGVAVARRGDATASSTTRTHLRDALTAPGVGGWLAAETLANAAWAGTLVYAGALLIESYQASTVLSAVLLALGAAAYVAGNLAFRRLADRDQRRPLVAFAVALAAATLAFGACRPSLIVSAALFAAAAFAAGGRTLLSSSFGLAVSPQLRPAMMAARAASVQFGYFTGSSVAGGALALGGYTAFGVTISALFLCAAVVLNRSPRRGDRAAELPSRLRVALDGGEP